MDPARGAGARGEHAGRARAPSRFPCFRQGVPPATETRYTPRAMAHRPNSRAARRSLRSSSLRAAKRALAPTSYLEKAHHFTPSGHAALAGIEHLPDLLGADATLALDGPMLCGALDFAFAGGGCLETLEHALDDAPLPRSEWRPDQYAADLFLPELVDHAFRFRAHRLAGPTDPRFVVRVLERPPADPTHAELRQGILAELRDRPEMNEGFRALYALILRLRGQFALQETTSRYEETRHRVETLTLLRDVIDSAHDGFADARSGLRRIQDFAAEIRQSEGYADLAELLAYEDHLARVNVQVQLGADGRLRRFLVLSKQENDQNRFHVSAWRRFWMRVGLVLRGYRMSSDELVERWLDHVFEGVKHVLPPFFQLLGHMELYLGMLAFEERAGEAGLEVCFAELAEDGGRRVRGLFNPLLLTEEVTPRPCDLDSEHLETIHLITGPNSGGKTRLLQALGVTQLFAHGGWLVPARQARLRRVSGLFVSLVGLSDPRPESGEGRLGTELIRIRELFETARPGALVILDEFCSGTNPSEGEEIFYLVLSLLGELGTEVFISTHFLAFARRLSETPAPELRLAYLQVLIDEAMHPTYGVGPGVATTSLAAQTAARLGVTREELLALVRRHTTPKEHGA